MAYVITEELYCLRPPCIDECPVDAISEGGNLCHLILNIWYRLRYKCAESLSYRSNSSGL